MKDPLKLIRFQKKAEHKAKYFASSQEAKDIASDLLLRRLEGRDTHQPIRFGVIESLRRNGWRTYAKRDAEFLERQGTSRLYISQDILLDLERACSGLEPMERAILILLCIWGFTEDEVGYCFNVNGARISQRYKRLQKKIRANLKGEK